MTGVIKSLFKRFTFSNSGTNAHSSPPATYVQCEKDKPYFTPYDETEASVYRHRRQVGVNLGSIFLLDKQLAPPSLRSCVVNDNWESELDFLDACMTLEQAKEALEDHWSTYVTEKDFEYLASIGINSVRIPIGYWIVGIYSNNDVFKKYESVYKNAWHWLLNMIYIASKYNIGVLIDLHGAPGGQNPFTHCGTSSHRTQFFKSSNQRLTLVILKKIAIELAPINNVIGLSILNEPIDDSSLPGFYISAYRAVRKVTHIMLPIYISDAHETKKYIEFIKRYSMKFVILDVHFPVNTTKKPMAKRRRSSAALSHSHFSAHNSTRSQLPSPSSVNSIKLETKQQSLKQFYLQSHYNFIVGEWSTVKDTELSATDHIPLDETQQFAEAQLEAYSDYSSGHYYWNYRTHNDGDYWSFLYCNKSRILPSRFLTGTVPEEMVSEISQMAKSIFKKYSIIPSDDGKDHKAYQQGFADGFSVALNYLEKYQSRVGFKQQLAHEHTKTKQMNKSYEHGYCRALFTVDHLVSEFLSNT